MDGERSDKEGVTSNGCRKFVTRAMSIHYLQDNTTYLSEIGLGACSQSKAHLTTRAISSHLI
jgi:hypothetical protein